MTHTYARKTRLDFRSFIKSRAIRLMPLHVFMLLVFMMLEIGKLISELWLQLNFNNPAFTGDYAPSGIGYNLLLVHAWIPGANPLSFNTPSWSISVEFYLYLLFYGTLILSFSGRLLLWGGLSFLAMLGLAFELHWLTHPALRGVAGFFLGALTYALYCQLKPHFRLETIWANLLECLLVSLIIFCVSSDFNHKSLWVLPLFALSVMLFANESGVVSRALLRNHWQSLGSWSYSIYMTHAAIIYVLTSSAMLLSSLTNQVWLTTVDGKRYFDMGDELSNHLFVVSYLLVVVLISKLTYRFIEYGASNVFRERRARPKPINC